MTDPAMNAAIPKSGIRKREVDGVVTEITRVYQVLTENTVTNIFDVVTGLPAAESEHPDYPDLVVMERNPTQVERDIGLRWEIEVVWRARGEDQIEQEQSVGRIIEVSGGPSSGTHALLSDAVTGDAVLNSAHDPFDDVVQVQSGGAEIVIVREENIDPKDVLPGLQGTVNENVEYVAGFAFQTRQARLTIRFRRLIRAAYKWQYTYTVTQKIQMAKETNATALTDFGWRVLMLDQGYKSLDDAEVPYVSELILEKMNGADGMLNPASRPVLLDGGGLIAGEGVFVNRLFDGYPLADWSALNLDIFGDAPEPE